MQLHAHTVFALSHLVWPAQMAIIRFANAVTVCRDCGAGSPGNWIVTISGRLPETVSITTMARPR